MRSVGVVAGVLVAMATVWVGYKSTGIPGSTTAGRVRTERASPSSEQSDEQERRNHQTLHIKLQFARAFVNDDVRVLNGSLWPQINTDNTDQS